MKAYLRRTSSARFSVLMALPLWVAYELGVLLTDAGWGQAGVRVGSDVWIDSLLATMGMPGLLGSGVAFLVIGIAVFWYERSQRFRWRWGDVPLLVVESLLYAIVLSVLVSYVVGALLMRVAPMQGLPLVQQLVLSLGAGLYEEVVFRVVLVSGLAALLRYLGSARDRAYVVAAVAAALIFSLVHYLGPLGDAFALGSFLYRALFGLMLNVVYVTRGFAVAAWTHALYDVMVTLA